MATAPAEIRPVFSKLNQNGRIVIPAEIREQLKIIPGENLLLEVVDGVLHIESHRARIRRIQEECKRLIPPSDVLLSDQLIADRREEFRREMEEALG